MTINKVLDKLWQDGTEFVSLNKLKKESKEFYYNYNTMINYLTSRGFLFKILKNTYYVKSQDELNSSDKNMKYTSLELVSRALKFLNVKNWYFGLYTALKIYDINPKKNSIDYLICNNTITPYNKIKVFNREFKIIRLKRSLFNFGIKKKPNEVKYSDLEKTILDLIYLWQLSNTPSHKINSEIFKYLRTCSIEKIRDYCSHYPESVQQLMDEQLLGVSS